MGNICHQNLVGIQVPEYCVHQIYGINACNQCSIQANSVQNILCLPHYWPFVRGIHRWIPLTKANNAGFHVFFLCQPKQTVEQNSQVAGDLRGHAAHYDPTVMTFQGIHRRHVNQTVYMSNLIKQQLHCQNTVSRYTATCTEKKYIMEYWKDLSC